MHTIESKANICCVRFNPEKRNYIAFGSADHHIHYYDLRQLSMPVHQFKGHDKAVSYVKFLNGHEMVSAYVPLLPFSFVPWGFPFCLCLSPVLALAPHFVSLSAFLDAFFFFFFWFCLSARIVHHWHRLPLVCSQGAPAGLLSRILSHVAILSPPPAPRAGRRTARSSCGTLTRERTPWCVSVCVWAWPNTYPALSASACTVFFGRRMSGEASEMFFMPTCIRKNYGTPFC